MESKSARDADHRLFDFRGAQPLFEAVRLYVERLETQLGEPRFVRRDEGKASDLAQKSEIAVARRGEFESYATIMRRALLHVGAGAERPLPHALGKKTTDIDIGERQLRFVGKARRLGENVALLADQRFSVPREVRRRLALPRRRIEIGRKAARRMRSAERLAIVGFADDRIRRREIEQHGRARQRGARRRGNGNPYVLANFRVDHESGKIRRFEKRIGAEGRGLSGDGDVLARNKSAGREVALFVKLAIIRQIDLGRHGEHAAAQDRHGAIIETPAMAQRRADDDQRMNAARGLDEFDERHVDGARATPPAARDRRSRKRRSPTREKARAKRRADPLGAPVRSSAQR